MTIQRIGKGTVWPSEKRSFTDTITGVTVTQLTDYCSHSFHIYFTNNSFYGDGKLLFASDRENVTNLYSMDLETGQFVQMTDLERGRPSKLQGTFLHPDGHEAYFGYNRTIVGLNLFNMEERVLYKVPEKYNLGGISCTADGKWLCFAITEDLSDRFPTDMANGYLGFEEYFAAKPHCLILAVSTSDGTVRTLLEERIWLGHVNTSPTQANLLSFCHEGPWNLVDHRIWVMDIETGRHWKVRNGKPNEYVGHEYWLADGIHIGYHGFTNSLDDEEGKIIGSVRYDNSEQKDYSFPFQNMHIHSNDMDFVVGDGQQTSCYNGPQFQDTLQVWRNTGEGFEGPRILCKHRGSFQSQILHVHPRLSPDGKQVLFTSDKSGYGNLYMVDVPDFESLPVRQESK
jgi:oligogalacturonide lyase